MNEPALETNQIANFIEELEALIKRIGRYCRC